MKKFFFITFFITAAFSQNLYFTAFKNVQKGKRILKTDPKKAQQLFLESYGYLKKVINDSIENNKPSSNAFNLLGMMYLNGWGVDKNREKAVKLLCAAQNLGNSRSKKTISKLKVKCKKTDFKELKQ